MSLSEVISVALAEKLGAFSIGELTALAQANSLGFGPKALHAAARQIAQGAVVDIPGALGSAKPVVIMAWSFVRDPVQYSQTYGLTAAEAEDLRGQLITNRDVAVQRITDVVTVHHRNRNSGRPVDVRTEGIPGARVQEGAVSAPARARREMLSELIRANGALYGVYSFDAEATGRPDAQAFRVRLGGGLYATAAGKKEAIMAARICRVRGRHDAKIAQYIAFWLENDVPRYGVDIPEKVTFDGRLSAGAALPEDPVKKAKTVTEGAAR